MAYSGDGMEPNAVRTVVVVGAGTMGHAIGQVFAQAGVEVNLVDTHETMLERAITSIRSNLKTLADHGRIETQDIPGIMNRIHLFTNLSVAAKDAGFAIEAVPESPDLKRRYSQNWSNPARRVLSWRATRQGLIFSTLPG